MRLVFMIIFLSAFISCARLLPPERPDVPASGVLVAATTDFSTGYVSAMRLDGSETYKDIEPLHSDAVVVSAGGSLFALNRLGADNIRRLNPLSGFRTVYEESLGEKSNPHAMAYVNSSLAAVTLYGKAYLLWINPETGREFDRTDLSAWSDADGIPEASGAVYASGKVYVAVQRLDRNAAGYWPPVGDSYLLRLDPYSRNVEASFLIPYSNPVSGLRYSVSRNSLILACPATFAVSFLNDGGLAEFDLGSQTFLASPLRETETGFEISDVEVLATGKAYIIGMKSDYTSVLASVTLNAPSTLKVLREISPTEGGFFSGMTVSSGGTLYVGDRTASSPGILMLNTLDDSLVSGAPVSIGLPPFDFELLE